MTCTDGDPETLENCRRNLMANGVTVADLADSSSFAATDIRRVGHLRPPLCCCQRLVWEDGWAALQNSTGTFSDLDLPEVVVGADLLYDPGAPHP